MSAAPVPLRWAGIYAILVTPFHDDLSIDWASLERQVEFCLQAGAHGLVGPAIAGEFYTLSDRERAEYYRQVARMVGGRRPFVATVSGVSGHHAAELARSAEAAGADALMAMPPYVVPGTGASVFAYYRQIAAASALPLVVQNAPAPLGSPLSTPELLSLLGELPSVAVVKEETFPNPQKVGQLIGAMGQDRAAVFGGLGGIYLLNELERGAAGSMPACQFLDIVVDLYEAYRTGDRAGARARFNALQPALVMERLYNMTFMKECLRRRGLQPNTLTRTPEPPMDAHDLCELDAVWTNLTPYFRL